VFVETSPGKRQAYWLLTEPSRDLDKVENINRRLAQALGGDAVWDRARIMRLPGFLNVKPEHPEHPRARLLEIHSKRRFILEEFPSVLPPPETQRVNRMEVIRQEMTTRTATGKGRTRGNLTHMLAAVMSPR